MCAVAVEVQKRQWFGATDQASRGVLTVTYPPAAVATVARAGAFRVPETANIQAVVIEVAL
jgi:hypothetical protein